MSELPPLTNTDDIAAEHGQRIASEELNQRIIWQRERQDRRLKEQKSGGRVPWTDPLRRYARKIGLLK